MSIRIFSTMVVLASSISAQQKSDFAGDYSGSLGPLHVQLHLSVATDGNVKGTVDSPDQGLSGLPCSDVNINGQAMSFNVPAVHGAWTGFLSKDGKSLSGMWSQGTPMQLNLVRNGSNGATPPATTPPTAMPPTSASRQPPEARGAGNAALTFGSDGSAHVPMSDGSTVDFMPDYIEVIQPGVPGLPPTKLHFNLKIKVGIIGQAYGGTGVSMNDQPINWQRKGPQYERLKKGALEPALDKAATAADMASRAADRPANALDYAEMVKRVRKNLI